MVIPFPVISLLPCGICLPLGSIIILSYKIAVVKSIIKVNFYPAFADEGG
jgi:hypothetical protein